MKLKYKEAYLKSKTNNRLSESDFSLPMEDFIPQIYLKCGSEKYGTAFQKKLLNDLKFKGFKSVDIREDRGDVKFTKDGIMRHCEVKISYLNQTGMYRIANLRVYQDYDYLILCFVDTESNFSYSFYLLDKDLLSNLGKNKLISYGYMNGTKKINSMNLNKTYCAKINRLDVKWLLDKENKLGGTSYMDLMEYLNSDEGKSVFRKPKKRYKLLIKKGSNNQVMIQGETNKMTVREMVKYLGPQNIYGYFFPSWLDTTPNEFRTVEIEKGWWLCDKISYRDIESIIRNINKIEGISINIIL